MQSHTLSTQLELAIKIAGAACPVYNASNEHWMKVAAIQAELDKVSKELTIASQPTPEHERKRRRRFLDPFLSFADAHPANGNKDTNKVAPAAVNASSKDTSSDNDSCAVTDIA